MNPNSYKNQIKVNHRIRALEVRVIGPKGAQVGILPIGQALKMASELGLDLVEIAPEAKPPVCRIVDFGKFRYEEAKKHKGYAKRSHATKLKELKYHVNIGEHDYSIKLRHATEFLEKGMRVKMSLYFRGREMQHKEFGMKLMHRIIKDMEEISHSDSAPKLLGKNLNIILVPGKAKPKVPQGEAHQGAPGVGASSVESPKSAFSNTIKIDLKPTSA